MAAAESRAGTAEIATGQATARAEAAEQVAADNAERLDAALRARDDLAGTVAKLERAASTAPRAPRARKS